MLIMQHAMLYKCGVCYAVFTYRGEDHRCPENDEGFFKEDVTICDGWEDQRCPENDEGFFKEDVTICDGCRDFEDQDS